MNRPPALASWAQLYEQARRRLGQPQEARWLIEEVAGEPHPAGVPNARAEHRLEQLIERRLGGEPFQYVLGRWGFRTLDLMVDRRVLIPRPETEQLVEVALTELDRMDTETKNVADLGTGSGAIALSIVAERKRVRVWATDVDGRALDVARANLSGLGGYPATRVTLVEGDWWAALPETLRGDLDLVVSNPPYIPSGQIGCLDASVRDWEPRTALEAGPQGTEALEFIIDTAQEWLRPGGVVVLEMAPDQATRMMACAARRGWSGAEVRRDLSGRDRVLVARKP